MSSVENGASTSCDDQKKYKGVRRRKWGKWVSEIRVPGKQERLWLGSYSTPEAAAVARDVAFYYLRRPSTLDNLNFPQMLPSYYSSVDTDMSPRYIQKVASDTGMAVDTRLIMKRPRVMEEDQRMEKNESASIDDCCWEGIVQGDACETWEGSNGVLREAEESLNISIEDYL